MVEIKVSKCSGDVQISIKGHANSNEYGKDIVCAGVSAVVQTALLGLEVMSENYPKYIKYTEGE